MIGSFKVSFRNSCVASVELVVGCFLFNEKIWKKIRVGSMEVWALCRIESWEVTLFLALFLAMWGITAGVLLVFQLVSFYSVYG